MTAPRVLLVEDNPQNRKLARILLELDGFAVDCAESGEEALQRLETFTPDILLVDVQLPGMDGMELVGHVRQRHPRLPIVSVTAYAMYGDRDRFLEAGCNGYLAKPIDQETFASQIRSFMGGS